MPKCFSSRRKKPLKVQLQVSNLTKAYNGGLILTPRPISELLRENKRMLDKSIRELDRERVGLQNQEKKLILEIKKAAKQGQMV